MSSPDAPGAGNETGPRPPRAISVCRRPSRARTRLDHHDFRGFRAGAPAAPDGARRRGLHPADADPGRGHPAADRRDATCSASRRPAPARPPPSRFPCCSSLPRPSGRPAPRTARALILAPTRELAVQIDESFAQPTAGTCGSPRSSSRRRRPGPRRSPRCAAASTSSSPRPAACSTSCEQGARPSRPRSRPSCSTRPTGCSTWASSATCARSSPGCRRDRQTALFSATMPDEVAKLAADRCCATPCASR